MSVGVIVTRGASLQDALREIVEAYPDLSRPTVDLLTSYLASVDYQNEEPPADVRAIMAMILGPAGKE